MLNIFSRYPLMTYLTLWFNNTLRLLSVCFLSPLCKGQWLGFYTYGWIWSWTFGYEYGLINQSHKRLGHTHLRRREPNLLPTTGHRAKVREFDSRRISDFRAVTILFARSPVLHCVDIHILSSVFTFSQSLHEPIQTTLGVSVRGLLFGNWISIPLPSSVIFTRTHVLTVRNPV